MDSRSIGADLSFAWLANEIAVMGAEAAVGVIHHKKLADAPYYASERGLVDDVIDPADTRAVITRALDVLSAKRPELAPRKHGNPPA
jgi:acetyl-CoA carboxylase carboxyltransferase component